MKQHKPDELTRDLSVGAALALSRLVTPVSDTPSLDIQLLLAHTLDRSRAWLYANKDESLTADQSREFVQLVERRASGEPVAHLTGSRDFWNFSFSVNQSVLIPRPETELLVESVLATLSEETLTLVDVGTGSGAVAISLADERPTWKIYATDDDAAAIRVARTNIDTHARGSVELLQGNWLEPLPEIPFDAVVANPPYIRNNDPHLAALVFEPKHALVAGADGLDAIRIITLQARSRLRPGGWLFLEHGYDQQLAVAKILAATGFDRISSHRDLAGHPRVTQGRAL